MRHFLSSLLLGLTATVAGCAGGDESEGGGRIDEACNAGERRCGVGGAQICLEDGTWSRPRACDANTTCQGGLCVAGCNGCTPGEARCAPEGVQECVAGDGGCGVWMAPEACLGGTICQNGTCGAAPADQPVCAPGETRCAGPGGLVRCADGVFGPTEPCPGGQVCSDGACVAEGSCFDACPEGTVRCLGAPQSQICTRGASGCLEWSAPVDCGAGRRCTEGVGCGDSCQDECGPGDSRCVDGGRQECVAGPDGCQVWGAIQSCDRTQQCTNGQCVGSCQDACMRDQRRCVNGTTVEYCTLVAGCYQWGGAQPCAGGSVCQNGDCFGCSPGSTEDRPCAGGCGGTESRTCQADGSWGAWSGCAGAGGACMPGETRACERCGTQRCTDQCQWGACEGQGVCSPGERGDCNECGFRICDNSCNWPACGNGDGTDWRNCNDCGWQFCCPDGDWCPCAARFPERCGAGESCLEPGVCQ